MQRNELWNSLEPQWDVVVVGGGITGAGIFREALNLGLKTLLVEAHDFASGTSSRSSKLVHGGLRYLKEGQVRMTWASVHERQQLLEDAPGLVEPLGFLIASYKGDWPPRWLNWCGVAIYDLMARRWQHRTYDSEELVWLAPSIQRERLVGGLSYQDAQTDDARLVLRLILDGMVVGGVALNYVAATELLRDDAGVHGISLRDEISGEQKPVTAKLIINATGAWADNLRRQLGKAPRIRPLRGSHLIFPCWRLPVAQAVSFLHPHDGRWIFIFPWENVVLVGTTDVDHGRDLNVEPRISPEETAYLMAAVNHQYPSLQLGPEDVMATFAGVRPVVGTGEANPYHESREHVVWQEDGLLTVTGGKLTTFRMIARDALAEAAHLLPEFRESDAQLPLLIQSEVDPTLTAGLDVGELRLLQGRYGAAVNDLVAAAQPGELERIPGTTSTWAELRWAARAEGVVHLEDLLSRRLRLALMAPEGGREFLPRIRDICRDELGWDEERWQAEVESYLSMWRRDHGVPDQIPPWQEPLFAAQQKRISRYVERRRRLAGGLASALVVSLFLAATLVWRKLRPTRRPALHSAEKTAR